MSEGTDRPNPDVVDTLFSYLDRFMDALHDRVLRPILLAGRFIAYGFILLLVGVVVIASLVIALVRFSTIYFFAHHVWITYLVVGAIFITLGLVIWRKRRPLTARKS